MIRFASSVRSVTVSAARPASGKRNIARASGLTNNDSSWLPMPRPPLERSRVHSSRRRSRTVSSEPFVSTNPMRYVYSILVVALLVGALVTLKYKQIASLISMGKKMEAAGPPPEAVGSSKATEESWPETLSSIGTIAPVQGVSVSNDAPGMVTRIHFESGALVKQGDVLVELDTSVENAQLASSLARKDLATATLERNRRLVASGTLPSANLDTDESTLKTTTADIDGVRAQIARKLVRAPFSGRLGIRNVNMGQYLNPGTTLAVLVGVEAVFVDFSLPQQDLARISVGMPVHVVVDDDSAVAGDGVIAAVDPTIDSATRNVKIRAQIPNKEEKLHSGMFAKVEVQLPKQAAVVAVPETALVHASYGDSVFVVEDPKGDEASGGDGRPFKIARQQFVKLGAAHGDFVAIVDGVSAGQELVTAGAFKLRNGSRVIVDNTVATNPELSPKLQNR